MKVTLTLTMEQAETLIETLKLGTSARFAHGLQMESKEVTDYVKKRIDSVKNRQCVAP